MEAKQYQGKSLQYLAIHPDGYSPEVDYPLVVLLHGFGANMHDLAGLCPTIDHESYLYACPNAPLSFQIGPGVVGYGWTPPRGEGTTEDAQRAVELLETTFDEVMEQYHVSPGRVILMGFSQGGGMTYRCGLGRLDMFAGLVALSSSMPDPEELKGRLLHAEHGGSYPGRPLRSGGPGSPEDESAAQGERRAQPIFIAHGIYDDLLPVDRAREARAFLEGEGYHPQYKEYPMRHEISQEVLDDLVPWMKKVLPPVGV